MARKINGISVSFDYSELIDEFQSDMQEGLLSDKVFVEREDHESGLYRPIADWYYSIEEVPKGVRTEVMNTSDVLAEMEELNAL